MTEGDLSRHRGLSSWLFSDVLNAVPDRAGITGKLLSAAYCSIIRHILKKKEFLWQIIIVNGAVQSIQALHH